MAIGSGLSSSFGWSKESTYGTRVAPAKFIRHRRCEFNPVFNRVQGEGIQSGALALRSDHYVQTHQQATASVEFDVTTLNMVQLFENLMGTTAVSAQLGSTAAYSHTLTAGDNLGKKLTVQTNVPLRDGTAKAKEIVGAKATSATISTGIGELLTCQMEFDGQKYDTGQTLASPSYVTGLPFHFGQANLKLGTFSSESAVTGVRSFSVTINRPMDTEAFTFNASGLKQEPVLNAPLEITGTVEADYLASADFETRYLTNTFPSLVFECVGTTLIESPYFPMFRLTLPGVTFDGPGQNVDGYDVSRNQWGFTYRFDGTNHPVILIYSSETTV